LARASKESLCALQVRAPSFGYQMVCSMVFFELSRRGLLYRVARVGVGVAVCLDGFFSPPFSFLFPSLGFCSLLC